MEIKGKVHCFFEQSGTFKNEFRKLGYEAEDYDIQNEFGETDHVVDLFKNIEDAYDGKPSLFDDITQDDLIMAFFPCIYFCAVSQMNFSFTCQNYKKMGWRQKTDEILKRSLNREMFFRIAVKMFSVCHQRNIKMIMENPWSEQTFLKSNFVCSPAYVDKNRMMRGDYRVKPTAYWYVNCVPTNGFTIQNDKQKEKKTHMTSRGSSKAGLCSEERSMISPDYARNFICDLIIGKEQVNSEQSLFKDYNK